MGSSEMGRTMARPAGAGCGDETRNANAAGGTPTAQHGKRNGMKTTGYKSGMLAAGIALALVGAAQADTRTWTQTVAGTQLWATTGNWQDGLNTTAAGDTVNFTANLAGGQAITMGSTRTVGTLNLGLSGNTFRYNFNNTAWILKANAGDTLGTATINVNNDVSSGDEHVLQSGIQMQVEDVNLNINSAGGELMFLRNFTDNDGDGTRSPTMTLSAVAGADFFEFRTTTRNQWGKLLVNQHATFRNRDNTNVGDGKADDRSLGIVLSSYLADAITLNGGTLQTGADLNYNINANRGITLGALGGTLDANGASRAWTVDSIITGTGGLTAAGNGNKTLNAANDYTGTTTVSAGTLILGASGSIANSSKIDLRSGATFDVSAIDSYTLSGSTTLSAAGTGATVGTTAAVIKGGTTVSLGSQAVALTFTPTSFKGDTAHPALVVSQGALTLNNNTISVDNASGTPMESGTYRLIEVTGGTINGAPNPSVTVTGSGTVTKAFLSVSGGYVNLDVVPSGTLLSIR